MTLGAPREHMVERDGVPATTHRLALSLAADNRMLQGPEALEFLGLVRDLLERAPDTR